MFVLAGRLFEAKAKRAAGDALRALAPARREARACLLREDGMEELIPAEALLHGDRFVVRPGETIATDGVVGSAAPVSHRHLRQMTGESVPVEDGPRPRR